MSINSLAGRTDHLLTSEEAEVILAPYRERLNRCIQHGWEVWKTDYAHKHHVLHARARAAIVFDEIVHRALQEFVEGPDLVIRRTHATLMMYIGDSLVLRFKKIGRNGRCSNILTRQQVLFRAQVVQLCLPTMQKGTLVHAGYQLDSLQQDIIDTKVVCQFNKRVLWQMSLGHAAVIEVMPTPQSSAPAAVTRFEPKPELVPQINNQKPGERS